MSISERDQLRLKAVELNPGKFIDAFNYRHPFELSSFNEKVISYENYSICFKQKEYKRNIKDLEIFFYGALVSLFYNYIRKDCFIFIKEQLNSEGDVEIMPIVNNVNDSTNFIQLINDCKEKYFAKFDEKKAALTSGISSFPVCFEWSEGKSPSIYSSCKLKFSFVLNEDGAYLTIHYKRALYHEKAILVIASHYKQILSSLINDPKLQLLNCNFMTTLDEQAYLDLDNQECPDFNINGILSAFDDAAKLYPDKIAIKACDRELSYSELKEKINIVSSSLVNSGVSKNTKVGILLPKNSYYPIAVLAVLNIKATFVPLSLSEPEKYTNEYKNVLAKTRNNIKPGCVFIDFKKTICIYA